VAARITWLVVGDDDTEAYGKYGDELTRFASALVGPNGAEDVVATAVLACFSTPRWPTVTNRRAYLYRAVLNQALKVRRVTERRLGAEIEQAGTDDVPDPGVGVDVIRALRQLSMRQRAVMFLTYWEESPPGRRRRTGRSAHWPSLGSRPHGQRPRSARTSG
jgi:DNA-directed RNA polymerase specialized sigma24 family protein